MILLLCGCSTGEDHIEKGMALRSKLLQSGCSFEADIIADYGEAVYTFTLQCAADPDGGVSFVVTMPETISGITGKLDHSKGALTFDGSILSFPMLADGELSPVSCPWILIHTLRAGYLRSAGLDGDAVRLTIDDSYESDALQLDIWLNDQDLPQYVQITWQGRRILSMKVRNFTFV